MTPILYQLPSLLSREIERSPIMYSYLINRIDAFSQRHKGYEALKGIPPTKSRARPLPESPSRWKRPR